VALLGAVLGSGCGYRLVDPRGAFGPGVEHIELRTFENRSAQPGFEQLLVDALSEEFSRRAALVPVYGGGRGVADLVLDGLVREVRIYASAYSPGAISLEDRIEVSIDARIRRLSDDEVLWRRDGWRVSEVFASSADVQTYVSNREQALRRLSSTIAERIHDELFQSF
jgi:hypothetical protein